MTSYFYEIWHITDRSVITASVQPKLAFLFHFVNGERVNHGAGGNSNPIDLLYFSLDWYTLISLIFRIYSTSLIIMKLLRSNWLDQARLEPLATDPAAYGQIMCNHNYFISKNKNHNNFATFEVSHM